MSSVMLRQSKAHERARAYVAVTKQATRSKSDCDAVINSLDRHRQTESHSIQSCLSGSPHIVFTISYSVPHEDA